VRATVNLPQRSTYRAGKVGEKRSHGVNRLCDPPYTKGMNFRCTFCERLIKECRCVVVEPSGKERPLRANTPVEERATLPPSADPTPTAEDKARAEGLNLLIGPQRGEIKWD
jgi:hypothetical protein